MSIIRVSVDLAIVRREDGFVWLADCSRAHYKEVLERNKGNHDQAMAELSDDFWNRKFIKIDTSRDVRDQIAEAFPALMRIEKIESSGAFGKIEL